MISEGEFNFGNGDGDDDDHMMPCPKCDGTGKVRWSKVSKPLARSDDPVTSQEGAKTHETTDMGRFRYKSHKGRLLEWFVSGAKATAQGAALKVADSDKVSVIDGCRKRVSEMASVGYVRDSGQRHFNPGATTEAIVYEITAAGEWAYANMIKTGWTR